MKMHILNGGRLRMRKSVYLPEAERTETIDLPVSCVLLRHAQGNVLFDTGCHPDTAVDATGRWGAMAKAMMPLSGPEDNVVSQLATLGLVPDNIDVVVNSHLHSDHCGCNGFFKRATFFCHYKELEAAQGPDAVQKGYIPADWEHPMPTEAIDGEHDVFGDGRLVLVPLPGHTPGSLGAVATLSRDGSFLLAADAVAMRPNLDREVMPRNTWNPDLAMASLREVQRIAASGAKVIFGHDPVQWAEMRKGEDRYE
ncbi:N-acyl homoserine lactonase family protein [Paraburkholderia dipogonis]|uniref:N-acyl homoserine lactonase family protein n=1 Tax=Paraburkholderia dipogonis TaxID=1211383 RepID=A0A4Y8MIY1_9BURK|nr:N-acyl homoserine lactonase family protein [Paraburkholderia dipogonis]TFE37426.1 N-acyl homoserine lactonase family protein [Paraburkholderia dipogonis]